MWFNCFVSQLTNYRSYLVRLNCVHENRVKHRLLAVSNQHPWCSAAWFENVTTPTRVRTIYRFPTGRVKVRDDFSSGILLWQPRAGPAKGDTPGFGELTAVPGEGSSKLP